jgi:16S rRNA (uracil1498-N3)-methyltransferase
MADRFYISCPLTLGLVTLRGAEAHHLATVRRFCPGDQVCLFNGDGHEYTASIVSVARREATLEILSIQTPQRESPIRIEVAAPLPKGDRARFLLEKLTELGVSSFVPLRTERSVVHPRETKLDHLQRSVIEVSKQCGRNVLLHVRPLTDWSEYSVSGDLPAVRLVADPQGTGEPWRTGSEMALAVGPEGGFTDEEMERARAHAWQGIHLGPRILRIETAAIVMAAWANLPFSRFRPAPMLPNPAG